MVSSPAAESRAGSQRSPPARLARWAAFSARKARSWQIAFAGPVSQLRNTLNGASTLLVRLGRLCQPRPDLAAIGLADRARVAVGLAHP